MTKTYFFHYYHLNVHISVNNEFENLKLCMYVANIFIEGNMSQIFASGPRFYFK